MSVTTCHIPSTNMPPLKVTWAKWLGGAKWPLYKTDWHPTCCLASITLTSSRWNRIGGSQVHPSKQKVCFSSWPAHFWAPHHKSLEEWKQINLTNNSLGAARPAELMAEEVAKRIKDSTETVTLCYRNQLNRFMLLPLRVGKVLRANSQVLALAREVKSIRSSPVTDQERKKWKIDWQQEVDRFAYFCLSPSCLDSFLIHVVTASWAGMNTKGPPNTCNHQRLLVKKYGPYPENQSNV